MTRRREQPRELTPRFRVAWRKIGTGNRAHAARVIERGRLEWQTLCGRPTQGSTPLDGPECGKCAELLEPLSPSQTRVA